MKDSADCGARRGARCLPESAELADAIQVGAARGCDRDDRKEIS